ncbi:MAG TPA: diguanylate cyclase [Terracidiphilus sp.]|jgi:diguanylate cyclase (GGDEF)-like protein
MPPTPQTTYLLASHEPTLLAAVEPVLVQLGACVQAVLSADAAHLALTAPSPPGLAFVDVRLPDLDLGRLLATAQSTAAPRIPVVLFSDTISEQVKNWIEQGLLDDLLPTTLAAHHLAVRLQVLHRTRQRECELNSLRNALARGGTTDRLTGVGTRDAILSQLFLETDRVQRMKTSLCILLFDIDDFGHWNARLGVAACDGLLIQVAERVSHLLRSYDLLGRVGKDEFLAGLPGCTPRDAVMLAERIRAEVFGKPFPAGGTAARLTACFAVATSNGRSPIVVLREAEEALRRARDCGPDTIHSTHTCPQPTPSAFFFPAGSGDLLGW